MSRLDSFIARMQAQRDCLNFLKPKIDAVPGPLLEVGLGNGRTYDHLRDLFPGRDIYVFERKVAAHPDCIPPDDRLFLGEAREAIPKAAQKLGATRRHIALQFLLESSAMGFAGGVAGASLGTLIVAGVSAAQTVEPSVDLCVDRAQRERRDTVNGGRVAAARHERL